jgi:hypothetical protein
MRITDVIGTVLKLLVASLIVGAILMWLDLDALGLLRWAGDALRNLAASMGDIFRWAIGPILLGATVVVPIWLILLLVRRARGR